MPRVYLPSVVIGEKISRVIASRLLHSLRAHIRERSAQTRYHHRGSRYQKVSKELDLAKMDAAHERHWQLIALPYIRQQPFFGLARRTPR